ncbi:low temperature requirement protein A [Micromonospora sp. WMMA1363]|uniref:low temperature requirement protein A n=1 Tax=Micromonospora sp. WMMA1363 TaxID=3053985 RepID=UPI00259D102F|nr:low temperature requirement protein A [Micromonospora sp. WMMA1363]MDM4719948.1 low temperature requirement protein A [Micromonospora sp. WMMA1363]
MGGGSGVQWMYPIRPGTPGARVTRLELFYDLVFVFAFLNVTTLGAADLDFGALAQSMLVLALLWWCWSSFTNLGNAVRADQGVIPLVGFATMAAVIVMALAVSEAYTDVPGGLFGPVVFVAAYAAVRGLQVAVLWLVIRAGPCPRRRMVLLAAPVLASAALLVLAAVVPQRVASGGAETVVRLALWSVAVALEYASGGLVQRAGWRLVSPGHWAERHALIVLIALGESIISLGLGPNLGGDLPITWPVLLGAVLGLAVVAAIWWSYFDSLVLRLEQALHRARGAERGALARDTYTYLHLPVIAGILVFALGLKRFLADISDPRSPELGGRLGGVDLATLYGGILLYLAAYLGLAARTFRQLTARPVTALVLIVAAVPLAARVPALAALGLLALITVAVTLSLLWHPPRFREQARTEALTEQVALEADQQRWWRRRG